VIHKTRKKKKRKKEKISESKSPQRQEALGTILREKSECGKSAVSLRCLLCLTGQPSGVIKYCKIEHVLLSLIKGKRNSFPSQCF